MFLNKPIIQLFLTGSLIYMLVGCYHPPYNNFQPDNRTLRRTAVGAGVGAAVGAAVGTATGNTVAGLAVGGLAGSIYGLYRSTLKELINELHAQDIQFVQYGDTNTLIVPTDKYFIFDSARLDNLCYAGLYNIVRLLQHYKHCTIYVAGFTDDVGSRKHKKKLSQAQAEAMLTYLWANDVDAKLLYAEGYGDLHPISDNDLIHGSAQNRRLEIQWINECHVMAKSKPKPFVGLMK